MAEFGSSVSQTRVEKSGAPTRRGRMVELFERFQSARASPRVRVSNAEFTLAAFGRRITTGADAAFPEIRRRRRTCNSASGPGLSVKRSSNRVHRAVVG